MNKKKILKSIVVIIVCLPILYGLWIGYSFLFEQEEIENDNYSFEQLEIIKNDLKLYNNHLPRFYNLDEFNKTYKRNIVAKNNCYYLKEGQTGNEFTFWFRYESLKNKLLNFSRYYVSPWKKFIGQMVCWGLDVGENALGCYYQSNKDHFMKIISNPCK